MTAASDAAYVLSTMYSEDKAPVGFIPSELELFDLMSKQDFRQMESILLDDHALHVVRLDQRRYIVCNEAEKQNVLVECFASATLH